MFVLNIVLGYQMYVGLLEIIVFLLGAMVLGFFIHFFMTSRKSLLPDISEPSVLADSVIPDNDEWRFKYYDEVEKQKDIHTQLNDELEEARGNLEEARSNEEILNIEIEELRKEIVQLQQNKPIPQEQPQNPSESSTADYLSQLKSAHETFYAHNQSIALLLEQIQALTESEQKHLDTLNDNDMLRNRLLTVESELAEKDAALREMQQHGLLVKEMELRLGSAYSEFNALREKLLRVEKQLAQPQNRQFEYDELQQNYVKLNKEFDDMKQKQQNILEENQRLSRLLTDAEDKLRESNFQRQQLNKKVSFLEELNRDMLQITEQNKKLENQLKRMSEIELLLARVADKGTQESDKASEE